MENKIDELFAKKIIGNKIVPSDRANVLFEQKLKEKRKKKVFVLFRNTLAVAASLVVLALVGVYFNNSMKPSTVAIITPSDIKINEAGISEQILDQLKLDNSIEKKEKLDNGFSTIKRVEASIKPENNLAQIQPSKTKVSQVNIAENNQVLVLQSQSKKIDTKPKEIAQAQQIVNKIPRNEEIIVYVSPIESEPKLVQSKSELRINTRISKDLFEEDVPEKTMVAKVLDEVKGLKKGESVDFNKLGFRSIEELALNDDGFIASEAKQLKQRIYWIKSKLNNTK